MLFCDFINSVKDDVSFTRLKITDVAGIHSREGHKTHQRRHRAGSLHKDIDAIDEKYYRDSKLQKNKNLIPKKKSFHCLSSK